MIITNLYENTNPSHHYYEQVAEKLTAGLQSNDDILDAAWEIVVKDLGRTVARNKFIDDDFESDLITAYKQLHKQGMSEARAASASFRSGNKKRAELNDMSDEERRAHDKEQQEKQSKRDDARLEKERQKNAAKKKSVAEGGPYDLPGIDYPRPGDTPAKPRHRGQQTPGVNPDDEDYFREIFRKKREAAKKAEQENKKKVNESVFLKEDRQQIYEQWNRVGTQLVEYRLTPQQIQDIFSRVEQSATQAGNNRTLAGRGVDKASELNAAWEGLKDQIQKSHPVKGFDDLYDTAAAKLKTATGGDEGVMQYVNKYRDFAKKHPYIQSAVYAALIAAAGLSGAGLGGAGAIGLLKMTDRLLQGDKASSALYKGAKTGALAMAAHSIADYFKNPNAQIPTGTPAKLPDGTDYVVQKGDTLSQIAQKNGVSVKDLMAANSGQTVPTGDRITWNDPNAFTDINPMGDAVPPGTGSEPTYDVRTKLTNPDVLQPGQKLNVPGSLGPTQTYADGVGTAADTWDKVKSGAYTPSEISRNQAAKWNLPGAGEYNAPSGSSGTASVPTSGRIPADQAPMYDPDGGERRPQDPAFDDGASLLKPDSEFMKMGGNASDRPTITPKGNEVDYASSKTNPWDRANAKVDADVAAQNAEINTQNVKASAEYSDWLAKNPGSPVPYDQDGNLMPGWKDDPEKPGFLKFNAPKLKESQIYMVFDSVVAGQKKLNEGMWDSVKGAAAKAGNWAQTKGHNLTTKITLDKLLQAWNKARKPMDSEGVRQVLVAAGVSPEVINSVYSSMKIPTQQTGPQGRVEPTMTATPAATSRPAASTTSPSSVKSQMPANAAAWNYSGAANASGIPQPTKQAAQPAATPSWADPKSGDYVGRREVARRMAAQPAPAANMVPQQGVVEADKKDGEAEPDVKDVGLQRAISRAKADFPTAGSGIEALAKDFMRSQDQDQQAFDQMRQAERKQDQMLAQIDQIDQEQNTEISDLENQNSTLSSRLRQLQNVNSQLEKKLASMSGRKSEKKSSAADADTSVAPTTVSTTTVEPAAPKTKNKPTPKAQPAKSSMKSTATQLAAPKADPMSAMTQRITKGDSSITDKVSGQHALSFEPSDNVLEPVIPQSQQNPRFAAARANASDADPRYYADLTSKIAKKAIQDPEAAQSAYRVHEGDDEEQEANYSNKYQDMVKRMGQKAREQEKSKPVDIADLARRLAAIEASKKD
jgi:LysM repeat protein